MTRSWFPRPFASHRGRPRPDRTPDATRFAPQVTALESREVPATFYVDQDATHLAAGTFNLGRADAVAGLTVGTNLFSNLDDATAAARTAAGRDTIRISAATYFMTNTDPAVTPSQNSGLFEGDAAGVDVLGSGVGQTVLAPNYDSSTGTAPGGFLIFDKNNPFSLKNLTLDGRGQLATRNISTGVSSFDVGTVGLIDGVAFQNIRFDGSGTVFGNAVLADNGSVLTVQNSTFTNIGRTGVYAQTAGTAVNLYGNTYTGKGAATGVNANSFDYFATVADAATGVISGNVVTNNIATDGTSRSGGVIVQDTPNPGGGGTAQIFGNTFGTVAAPVTVGVFVGFSSTDTSTADVRFNNLIGTTGVLGSNAGVTTTAFYNFWGSPTGPTSPQVPGGTGSAAAANVRVGPVRGGPITPFAAPTLTAFLQSTNPIGPTLAFGPGAGAGSGVGTTLALTPQTTIGDGAGNGKRVTLGDVNGDGTNDTVVASGFGVTGRVTVFDGRTGGQLFQFGAIADFSGGLFVAAADFNRDGFAEVVVTPDAGGGPRVQVFSFESGNPVVRADFFALDQNIRTGLTVATGDVNGDRFPDLVVVPGPGGGPLVAVIDGRGLMTNSVSRLFADRFLFEESLRTGLFVAVGDVDGDGFADIIASAGPGGSGRVVIFSGFALVNGTATGPMFNFFVGGSNNRDGLHVAAVDLDGDAKADLVTGATTSSVSRVFFGGTSSLAAATPDRIVDLLNIDTGVFVGG